MKKIIAINAGPRVNWNTDQLIKAACNGAKENGAEVEYIHLYKMDAKGCASCFGCKLPKTFGKCVIKDDVGKVLEKIREADGLIIGSPNYLGNLTASFRAIYERLVFQSLTYNKENPCDHPIPVLLITTSNCDEDYYDQIGYSNMLKDYTNTLSRFVGPTKLFVCGNTLQVNNYDLYNWTIFDPESKKQHHDETFEQYVKQAFELGKEMKKERDDDMQLILIRHGISEMNRINDEVCPTFCGRYDCDLSKKGVEQASALHHDPLFENIDLVYCSPLKRAIQTTQFITDHPYMIDERITERTMGVFDGMPINQAQNDPRYTAYFKDPDLMDFRMSFTTRAPEGENYQDVVDRVSDFLDELKQKDVQKVVIVSHMAAIRCMLKVIRHLSNEETFALKIKQCEPIIEEW